MSASTLHLDGWTNLLLGFGATSKTQTTTFTLDAILDDTTLTALFQNNDLAAKIVALYPRQALRQGFELGGFEDSAEADRAQKTLAAWDVAGLVQTWAIWGRLYGLAGIWLGTEATGDALLSPLRDGETVRFLRGFDARKLRAQAQALDAQGKPVLYSVTAEGKPVMTVHASRLVLFGGALTDDDTRRTLGYRDLSVLQTPWDALRSSGNTMNSIENILAEASLGIMTIKDLWAMLAAGRKEDLSDRITLFNAQRSLAKTIVLDQEKESYKREVAAMTGLPDMFDRAVKRVAAAADIPVTILMGESPAGLNATGDADVLTFFANVEAYRTHKIEPQLTQIVQAVLGVSAEVTIRWPPLWTPTAKERSEIYAANAQGDVAYIQQGVITPEEVALSRFRDEGYSQEIEVEREIRATETGPVEEAPGTLATEVPGAPVGENVQTTVLNGAQIASLVGVVKSVAAGEIPRDSGVQILATALQLTPVEADRLMGSAGRGFVATQPPSKPPTPPLTPEEPFA
jgi:phage-related protein (TIGR01555 family)